jgi:hypothetical protein
MQEVVVQAARTPDSSGFVWITLAAVVAVAIIWRYEQRRRRPLGE